MLVIPARIPLRLSLDSATRAHIREQANGRPLVIDWVSSRMRGWTVGELTVDFQVDREAMAYVQIDSIDEVPVVIERRLLPLVRHGARLKRTRTLAGRGLGLMLDHAEEWLDFLDGRLATTKG